MKSGALGIGERISYSHKKAMAYRFVDCRN
jgi:hypothetical protein